MENKDRRLRRLRLAIGDNALFKNKSQKTSENHTNSISIGFVWIDWANFCSVS